MPMTFANAARAARGRGARQLRAGARVVRPRARSREVDSAAVGAAARLAARGAAARAASSRFVNPPAQPASAWPSSTASPSCSPLSLTAAPHARVRASQSDAHRAIRVAVAASPSASAACRRSAGIDLDGRAGRVLRPARARTAPARRR
ncbi:MAG: hypothetical protein MZW92_18135 [Comamonadaceae bacterium]|nr:hypothetical protein [Comamonadaceae bacterium]